MHRNSAAAIIAATICRSRPDVFAISATCSYAQWLLGKGKPTDEILSVADYFCRSARMRIDHYFAGTARNADKRGYNLVQDSLAGKHELLRQGIV
ncbi:MAG: hypothetical protein ACM3NN_07345 [Nitrospirota bacterium]